MVKRKREKRWRIESRMEREGKTERKEGLGARETKGAKIEMIN